MFLKRKRFNLIVSPNELTSNDIYGSGNKEMNANNTSTNAGMFRYGSK